MPPALEVHIQQHFKVAQELFFLLQQCQKRVRKSVDVRSKARGLTGSSGASVQLHVNYLQTH